MAGWLVLGTARWGRYLASALLTLGSLGVVTVLWRELRAIADPGLILLLTVAASTYLAGGMAGMLSAAIVLFSSFLIFSHPLYPFRYSDLEWRQMMVIAIACPLVALMVGSLKEQVDRLRVVQGEAERARREIRRLEPVKEAAALCEQRFRHVADNLPDYALCTLDEGGIVTRWNAGAERLLGYAEPEIRNQSYSRFFNMDDLLARQPDRLLAQARRAGRAQEETAMLRKGGARFPARVALFALSRAPGRAVGYVLIVRDLSELAALSGAQGALKRALRDLEAHKGGRS